MMKYVDLINTFELLIMFKPSLARIYLLCATKECLFVRPSNPGTRIAISLRIRVVEQELSFLVKRMA